MILAMAARRASNLRLSLFAAGALSPADDLLDIAVAALMVRLLGWHWEFLPAFAAELVPAVDLVPFWTLAVLNVYRKWKQIAATPEETHGPASRATEIVGFRRLLGDGICFETQQCKSD